MGTTRFFLALLVALSHAGVSVGGHNIGVVAVVSFLLLSGFVMTALISGHYDTRDRVGSFYLDRLARIYPQYGTYATLALLAALAIGPERMGITDLGPLNLLANITVVPLDFFMFGGIGNGLLLAPAWSLGLEVTFYLVIPWLLIYRLRGVAFAASLVIFAAGLAGLIDSDLWGYRLLPGTLFIFILGSYLWQAKKHARLLFAVWTAACAAALAVEILSVNRPRMPEVLIGIVVGIPLVAVLAPTRFGKLDEALGNISYGLFLNHFPMYYLAKAAGASMASPAVLAVWILACSALGWLSYIAVERPLLAWRRQLRARSTAARSAIAVATAT